MSHLLTIFLAQPLKSSSLCAIGSLISYTLFFLPMLYAQEDQNAKRGIAIVDTNVIYAELPSHQALQERLAQLEEEAKQQIIEITENNKAILEEYQEIQEILKNVDISEAHRKSLVKDQQQHAEQIQQIQRYIQQEQHRLQTSIQALFVSQLSRDKQELKSKLAQLAQEQGYEILLDKSLVTDKQLPILHYNADKFDQTELFLSLLLADS